MIKYYKMAYFLPFLLVVSLSAPHATSATQNDKTRALFSTKTTYAESFGSKEDMTYTFQNTKNLLESRQPSCRPVQITTLLRHATRYPSYKDFKVLSNLGDLQENVQNDHYFKLKSWKNKFSNIEPKILAETGRREMHSLGERFAQYFSGLLTRKHLVDDRFKFISSNLSRTKESAEMFMKGLQSMMGSDGDEINFNIEILNSDSDIFLRFFDACDKFVKTIEKNKTALIEFSKFGDGGEVQAVVEGLQQRLNIGENITLKKAHAKAVFSICAYELAILGQSDWCDVLTPEDIQVIEYWNDLKHYWRKGYGYELNYHISCRLLQRVFGSMEQAVSRIKWDDYTLGTFYFGHAETIFPFLSVLGLFNDTIKLTADNYNTSKYRLFRGGKISPFAANVAVILYSCSEGNSDFMVEVLVQETPVTLPCCQSSLCPYEIVKNCYSKWLNDCNFEQLCDYENQKTRDEL